MAFTIKYRTFNISSAQNAAPGSPTFFDTVEQLTGPYDLVSQEVEDGCIVVHCHLDGGAPGCTFGPWRTPDETVRDWPRPTLWVMNESGATVAKYDL